jgi:hypothetical protein
VNFWEVFAQALQTYIAQSKLSPANTAHLTQALTNLQSLLPKKETTMTTPNVQVAQADLDKFAQEFAAVFTALKTFIATLQANLAAAIAAEVPPVPLSEADESGLAAALAAGEALEPPSGA